MYVTETGDAIPVTEQQAQQLVGEWLAAVGLPPDAWPIDRDTAGEVLYAAGYKCDGDELRRLAAMGQTPSCEMYDGRDLIAAMSALEARRQWRVDGPHRPKMNDQVALLEELLADGDAGLAVLRENFKRIDLRLALCLLVEAPNRELRERSLATVLALLALQGIRV